MLFDGFQMLFFASSVLIPYKPSSPDIYFFNQYPSNRAATPRPELKHLLRNKRHTHSDAKEDKTPNIHSNSLIFD